MIGKNIRKGIYKVALKKLGAIYLIRRLEIRVFLVSQDKPEREGFEPSMRFLAAYTLSKRAPSATRPPLLLVYKILELCTFFFNFRRRNFS